MLPLFVECSQCVYGARSAGLDQSFSTGRTDLSHKDRYLLVVELEHAWLSLDAVPEADTEVSVDMDPKTPYYTLGKIKNALGHIRSGKSFA